MSEATSIKFTQWLRLMSFVQFHAFCGMLWDSGKKKFLKWELWKGVRGFPGQMEVAMAFMSYAIIWVLKARQLGLSELAGLYAVFVCLTEPNSEVIIISKKLPDAKYFLKRRVLWKLRAAYALEMEPGKKFPWPEYVDNSDTGKILFPENGSWIEAASSDNEEVRSRTPRLVIFDEVRSFSEADADELWSAIIPAIESNEKSQLICISTAKFGTWFNAMTKKIMEGALSGIKFLFLPADTDPKRTPDWRKEKLKKWSKPTLFIREYPLKEEDCFVSREGAVFSPFDPKPGGRHVNNVKLNWTRRYVIGYDHGRQHPAVLLLMQYDRYENHLYVFDEVFCRDMELPEVAFEIKSKLLYYTKNHQAPPPSLRIADRACFNKDGRKPVAEILRELTGIVFKESIKPSILDSIDDLNLRFSNNQITIDPRCVQTIRQLEELRWKNEPGEVKKEAPIDIEDDAPDILRYVCAELRGSIKEQPEKMTLRQQLEARDRMKRARRHSQFDTQTANPNAWQAG
jgi:hypothetical protein